MTWQEHTVKLSNVVNSDVVKKNVYDKLVVKVNNIDTSRFVLKTKYDTDKSYLEKKISDAEKKSPTINGIKKKKDYNAKITEIESKIPSITGLATTAAALTTVENEMLIIYLTKKKKKKKIMMQKNQILILKINISLELITIDLLKILQVK